MLHITAFAAVFMYGDWAERQNTGGPACMITASDGRRAGSLPQPGLMTLHMRSRSSRFTTPAVHGTIKPVTHLVLQLRVPKMSKAPPDQPGPVERSGRAGLADGGSVTNSLTGLKLPDEQQACQCMVAEHITFKTT